MASLGIRLPRDMERDMGERELFNNVSGQFVLAECQWAAILTREMGFELTCEGCCGIHNLVAGRLPWNR